MAREGRELGWAGHLDSTLRARLPRAPGRVAALVEGLIAAKAATRLAALDHVQAVLLAEGAATEEAPELLPYLIALGGAPRYPEAAALLVRITRLMAAIDEPPRSLSGGGGTASNRQAFSAIAARLPSLLRTARSSTSPEAARLAACVCARFPEVDEQLQPVLIALLSGAHDADDRARLLYALTRVQASLGVTLHRRATSALAENVRQAETIAVMIALSQHELPSALRTLVLEGLTERLRSMEALGARDGAADPTTWGRTLSADMLERAVARLTSSA